MSEDKTDYKALLKKYMDHVWEMEGISFLEPGRRPNNKFSNEEWAQLKQVADEITAEESQ